MLELREGSGKLMGAGGDRPHLKKIYVDTDEKTYRCLVDNDVIVPWYEYCKPEERDWSEVGRIDVGVAYIYVLECHDIKTVT